MIPPYAPKFTHTDWIDNEDRVQAGGENGFNLRFHKLEAEFATLADEHLNPLIQSLARADSFLSLVPILTPTRVPDTGTQPPLPWLVGTDVAQKAPGAAEAHGIMNVVLPEGVELKSFQVFGTKPNDGSTITVTLRRKDFSGAGAEDLCRVTVLNTPANPLTPAKVTNKTHRYFITADLSAAPTAAGADSVKLSCFQISYQ